MNCQVCGARAVWDGDASLHRHRCDRDHSGDDLHSAYCENVEELTGWVHVEAIGDPGTHAVIVFPDQLVMA